VKASLVIASLALAACGATDSSVMGADGPAAPNDLSGGGDQAGSDLSGPQDLADSGSGAGNLAGTISSLPMTIGVPGSSVAQLPVLDVYWLENQTDWYSDLEWCATAFGAASTTYAFSVQTNGVTLLQSYCTAGATRYQVVTRPAKINLQRAISGFPTTISDPSLTAAPLPSLSVFFSNDGASWYPDDQACAVAFGSSTIAPSFVVTNGQITFPANYCTANAKFVQVSTRPGTHVLQGAITAWPIVLNDTSLTTNALPNISVYWSNDGVQWYSRYERCAQGSGLARSFLIHEGQLVLQQNYCTTSATQYQVVIDDQ